MNEAETMEYGYIFDFDGVLANTMEAHFACYQKALAEIGVPIVKEQFYSQAGMTALEQIRYFCCRAGIAADYQSIYERKRELFSDHLLEAQPIRCNIELLGALRQQGAKVAIATGSSRRSVLPVMEMLGIEVDALATAEDVTRGKPNPDLFLAAAEKLGLAADQCIVIEDSDAGIEAAKAASMRAMRFYDRKL